MNKGTELREEPVGMGRVRRPMSQGSRKPRDGVRRQQERWAGPCKLRTVQQESKCVQGFQEVDDDQPCCFFFFGWVFSATLGLFLAAASMGLSSSCGADLLQRLLLWRMGSRACGLSSYGSRA